MIIVTGTVLARADRLDEALSLSLEHVRRSRTEPGCLSHAVSRDAEDPLRLTFLEEWVDREALAAHFALPASRTFAKAMTALASETPTVRIFDADPVSL